jgi:hypothetical protein
MKYTLMKKFSKEIKYLLNLFEFNQYLSKLLVVKKIFFNKSI